MISGKDEEIKIINQYLHERQRELQILELCVTGERHYLKFNPRQLYEHVVASVNNHNVQGLLDSSTGNASLRFHLRDMRNLLRPQSAVYHPPSFIIRRHVMVLSFDPLRAIILRDRMLMLVPSSSTGGISGKEFSLMNVCEKRLKGGRYATENDAFEEGIISSITDEYYQRRLDHSHKKAISPVEAVWLCKLEGDSTTSISAVHSVLQGKTTPAPPAVVDRCSSEQLTEGQLEYKESMQPLLTLLSNEFEHIEERNFLNDIPFELQAVDVFLETVASMLADDVAILVADATQVVSVLSSRDRKREISHYTFEALGVLKNESKEIEARLTGFERALEDILGNDETLALMNLSRLVTHPERFVSPISLQILDEESDKPELILESYVEQIHSLMNSVRLLNDRMKSTSMHIQFKLDRIQNRLLFLTTLFNAINLVLATGIVIFGFFGMNLSVPESTQTLNYIFYHDQMWPYSTGTFNRILCGTLAALALLCLVLVSIVCSPWFSGFDM